MGLAEGPGARIPHLETAVRRWWASRPSRAPSPRVLPVRAQHSSSIWRSYKDGSSLRQPGGAAAPPDLPGRLRRAPAARNPARGRAAGKRSPGFSRGFTWLQAGFKASLVMTAWLTCEGDPYVCLISRIPSCVCRIEKRRRLAAPPKTIPVGLIAADRVARNDGLICLARPDVSRDLRAEGGRFDSCGGGR